MKHLLAAALALSPLEVAAQSAFTSAKDSVEWNKQRVAAETMAGRRVVVSLRDKYIWVMNGNQVEYSAEAGVATGDTFRYKNRTWSFVTPPGMYNVQDKKAQPLWVPPMWAYAEAAANNSLQLVEMHGSRTKIGKDSALVIKNGHVQLEYECKAPSKCLQSLPLDQHIVFGNKLYVPPAGSKNRAVPDVLGKFGLYLGNGYMIHGTPDEASVRTNSTHGCIRLKEQDITWMYNNIPKGTKVVVY